MEGINKIRLLLGIPLDTGVRVAPEVYNFYTNVAGLQGMTLREWVEKALDKEAQSYKPVIPEEPTVETPYVDDRHPCKWWTGRYIPTDQVVECGLPAGHGRSCRFPVSTANNCPDFSIKLSWVHERTRKP